ETDLYTTWITVGDDRLSLKGEQEYTFEYMVLGAVQRNGEVDRLIWQATGGWDVVVDQATATVILSKEGLDQPLCQVFDSEGHIKSDKCQSTYLSKTEGRYTAK